MKLNLFSILCMFLVSSLCILANLVIDDNLETSEIKINDLDKEIANSEAINVLIEHITNTIPASELNRRANGGCWPSLIIHTICTVKGPKYIGRWRECNFDCLHEPHWACSATCNAYKGCGCY